MFLGVTHPVFRFMYLASNENLRSQGHVVNKTILHSFLPNESSVTIDSPMFLPKHFHLRVI